MQTTQDDFGLNDNQDIYNDCDISDRFKIHQKIQTVATMVHTSAKKENYRLCIKELIRSTKGGLS
jgi:hypothetical protein